MRGRGGSENVSILLVCREFRQKARAVMERGLRTVSGTGRKCHECGGDVGFTDIVTMNELGYVYCHGCRERFAELLGSFEEEEAYRVACGV